DPALCGGPSTSSLNCTLAESVRCHAPRVAERLSSRAARECTRRTIRAPPRDRAWADFQLRPETLDIHSFALSLTSEGRNSREKTAGNFRKLPLASEIAKENNGRFLQLQSGGDIPLYSFGVTVQIFDGEAEIGVA